MAQDGSQRVHGHRRRRLLAALAGAPALAMPALRRATAQGAPLRIGVLTDMSTWGKDNGGPGAVWAVREAVKAFDGMVAGRLVEVRVGDHQMSPDLGMTIARRWLDEGIDAITDLENSAVALGVSNLCHQKDRIALVSGAGSSELTNSRCNSRTVFFTYDTYSIAKVTADALSRQGAKTWFFISADYAFGKQLQADATGFIEQAGGKVAGAALHPSGTADFSSFLLQARASEADVVALANTGADCTNALKQAAEFGLARRGQKIAALSMFDTDIMAAGLETAQDTLMATSAWADMNDETRAWAAGYHAAVGLVPTMLQIGDYGVTLHYLKAVRAAGTAEPERVMAKMRELPIEDAFVKGATLRADGRVMRDMHLMRVRKPAEAKPPFGYMELISTVRAEDAFRPPSASACPLLRRI